MTVTVYMDDKTVLTYKSVVYWNYDEEFASIQLPDRVVFLSMADIARVEVA